MVKWRHVCLSQCTGGRCVVKIARSGPVGPASRVASWSISNGHGGVWVGVCPGLLGAVDCLYKEEGVVVPFAEVVDGDACSVGGML
jgi:hypothetical protein